MESELKIRVSAEKKWKDIKFALWGRFMIEREYKRCIRDARISANNLERKGLSPEDVSKKIQKYLSENCPNLQVIVDGNDVYIEKISAETRIYFDWRASIKA
ncbi:MAG: hypothetical protein QG639_376 [Patescibacteria group bacterium]|nr:hypothetical protein [Patescibacteria group bacterium]